VGDVVDLPLGHWPICDQLLKDAETERATREEWAGDFRAQAELVYEAGNPTGGYWQLSPSAKLGMLSRLMALVPRIGTAPTPRIVAERLFRLWHGPNPMENIGRALQVTEFAPRAREPYEQMFDVGGKISEFIDWTSESDCPIPFLFAGALALIASCCRFQYYIDRGNDMLRMGSYYAVLSGDKGTHKSVSLDAMKEVLVHLNHQVYPWDAENGQGLPDFTKANPFKVRMLPEDTNWRTIIGCLKSEAFTFTGLMDADEIKSRKYASLLQGGQYWGTEHGVLLLDEAATFFGKQNFAVDRVPTGMNALYGGKPYVYQTQSGGYIELKRPSLTFMGCCPPDIMASAVTPLLISGGMMDRTIVVFNEPLPGPGRYSTPRPRCPLRAAELARDLMELTKHLHAYQLVADKPATRFYDEWYHSQTAPLGRQETSLSRRANHLWKYAGYIAISNGNAPMIRLADFERAVPILEYTWTTFRDLLTAMERDPAGDLMTYLEDVMYAAGAIDPDFITRRDLFQVIRNRKDMRPPNVASRPYLESLEQAGRIKRGANTRGEWFQLTAEAAEHIRQGRPSQPRTEKA
jgi:hypothetical protein